MVLDFLTPKDKKNLKLASKACERRVMANNPAMRKWKIIVERGGKCFKEIILPLAKAKLRHVEDGIFPDIELSVEFKDEKEMLNEDVEKMVMLSEIMLKSWKNNIVELTTFIYGVEFFLLDPELRLPKLKNLSLYRRGNDYSSISIDTYFNRISIASALIQNNAYALETLKTNIDVDITKPLELKRLVAICLNPDSVSSLLHNTSKTLESLQLGLVESQTLKCCPELKLRELSFCCGNGYPQPCGHDIILVLKACQQTLKLFEFVCIDIELKDEIKSVQMVCLEELVYYKSNVADLPVMLKANSSTLKKLQLIDVILTEETMMFDDNVQLSLETFVVKSIPQNLATFLINASMKTLSVLHLEKVKDDLQDLILDKLQLKELYLIQVHANTVAKLISASENLEVLYLSNISCTNEIDNKLVKLKLLDCNKTCLHLTENLTKLANLSLTELQVISPRTCN